MQNELAKVPVQGVALVDDQSLRDYLFGLKDPITEKQQNLFLNIARVNNLNPFKREIYAVGYGDNFSIITGYQVYIDKANATGLLNGWKVETLRNEAGELTGARVIIHRRGWDNPFEWDASLSEFAKMRYDTVQKKKVLVKNWAEMPEFMIKKVVIGQGFRLCFPSELGALPYLAEEITKTGERDVMDAQFEEVVVDDDAPDTKAPEVKKETPAPTVDPTPTADVPKYDDGIETTAKGAEMLEKITESGQGWEIAPDVVDLPAGDAPDAPQGKLPANKVKQVQMKWKEFAEKSKWNFEDSERKRKATMNQYYWVDTTTDLTVEQADEFVVKIGNAIEKIAY